MAEKSNDHSGRATILAAFITSAGGIVAACINAGWIPNPFSPSALPPTVDVVAISHADAFALAVFIIAMFVLLFLLAAREQIKIWWHFGRF